MSDFGDPGLAERAPMLADIARQPYALNPLMPGGRQIAESLRRHRGLSREEAAQEAVALLARLADRAVAMYAERIVEGAPADRLYAAPAHAYTAGLPASTSRFDVALAEQGPIPGAPRPTTGDPDGCALALRGGDRLCRVRRPKLEALGDGRRAACLHPLAGFA